MEILQTTIEQLGSLSYIGLFVVGFLAQAVIPVPEEMVLIALGYVVSVGGLSWWIAIPVILAGVLVDDVVIFLLSYHGNKAVRFTYEKIFSHIVPMDEPFIRRHIKTIIVVSRFVIQLRFLGPFFAGYIKTPLRTFIAYDFVAAIIYSLIYIALGAFFSNKLELIIGGINQAKNIVWIVVGILLIISLIKGLKKIILGWYAKKEFFEAKKSNLPPVESPSEVIEDILEISEEGGSK